MPYSVVETSSATTTFPARYRPTSVPDIVTEAAKWTWSPREDAAPDSGTRYRETEIELEHANRVAILGQLSASIAHEVNQPIAAVVTNAQVALRMLSAESPNLELIQQALTRIVRDGKRAGDIVGRTRALARKASPRRQSLDINEAILEAIGVTHGEAVMNRVSIQTRLAEGLPLVQGEPVQLQQVMINLIINAVEAMSTQGDGGRDLVISTVKRRSGGVLVAVRDCGPGVDPEDLDRIFDAFYSTKPDGLGMGLSICRAIIERHGGKLWATRIVPQGTIFQFTLPASMDRAS
jgi:C4-dicarboxylate-specific signal transduction histidine kinase